MAQTQKNSEVRNDVSLRDKHDNDNNKIRRIEFGEINYENLHEKSNLPNKTAQISEISKLLMWRIFHCAKRLKFIECSLLSTL